MTRCFIGLVVLCNRTIFTSCESKAPAAQLHRVDHRVGAVAGGEDRLDLHTAQSDFRLVAGTLDPAASTEQLTEQMRQAVLAAK